MLIVTWWIPLGVSAHAHCYLVDSSRSFCACSLLPGGFLPEFLRMLIITWWIPPGVSAHADYCHCGFLLEFLRMHIITWWIPLGVSAHAHCYLVDSSWCFCACSLLPGGFLPEFLRMLIITWWIPPGVSAHAHYYLVDSSRSFCACSFCLVISSSSTIALESMLVRSSFSHFKQPLQRLQNTALRHISSGI